MPKPAKSLGLEVYHNPDALQRCLQFLVDDAFPENECLLGPLVYIETYRCTLLMVHFPEFSYPNFAGCYIRFGYLDLHLKDTWGDIVSLAEKRVRKARDEINLGVEKRRKGNYRIVQGDIPYEWEACEPWGDRRRMRILK